MFLGPRDPQAILARSRQKRAQSIAPEEPVLPTPERRKPRINRGWENLIRERPKYWLACRGVETEDDLKEVITSGEFHHKTVFGLGPATYFKLCLILNVEPIYRHMSERTRVIKAAVDLLKTNGYVVIAPTQEK